MNWNKKFSLTKMDVDREMVWSIVADVDNIFKWNQSVLYSMITNEPKTGANFVILFKSGDVKNAIILSYVPFEEFIYSVQLPFAKLMVSYKISEIKIGAVISVNYKITGVLSFYWAMVLGKNLFYNSYKGLNDVFQKSHKSEVDKSWPLLS